MLGFLADSSHNIFRSCQIGRLPAQSSRSNFPTSWCSSDNKMPHLKITTNVSKSSVPGDFIKETSALISKMLGKPEKYCVITVVPDQMMLWGGEEGPCAIVHLMSIGKLGVKENKNYSKILGEHMEKHLGVAPNHMYIEYQDIKTADLGYDRTTFHDILG